MLKDQILKTIKYFDIQDHCLTLLEIHKYLLTSQPVAENTENNSADLEQYSLSNILNNLEGLVAKNLIQQHSGFYFISGRTDLVAKRLQNNFYATPRLKRAAKFLPFVRHIPFIRAVALTGSEALNNSKEGSDIDLLVLTKPGRIWLGRVFLTTYFQILGIRRHGDLVEDRFCLNHYIEEGKVISEDQNIYTAIEYVSLVPYFGAGEIYSFQKKNLNWIKKYLNQPQLVEYKTKKASGWQKALEVLLDNTVGDYLEKLAGKMQRRRIEVRENIVVAPDELAFHPGSKGQQVLSKINF